MRADRLLGILLMLDKKGKVTAPELAGEFEASVRTIYRDIEVLSLHFPIHAESGPDGGFTLMPGYKLPNIAFLSRKDVMALHLMGSVAGQKLGLIPGKDFKGAYLKLYSHLNKMYAQEDRRISERIVIDVEPWNTPPKVPRVIASLRAACDSDLVVAFDYEKRGGKTENQEVDPYGLCFRSGFWYLVGLSLKRKDYRLFRTDRISKIKVTGKKFSRNPKFSLDRFWNEEFPRQYREKGFPVRILFDKSVANDVKSKKWGGGEPKTLPDGRLELSFKTFDLRGMVSFVLSFGPKAELVEPGELRERIKTELRETIGRYE